MAIPHPEATQILSMNQRRCGGSANLTNGKQEVLGNRVMMIGNKVNKIHNTDELVRELNYRKEFDYAYFFIWLLPP